MQLRPNVLKLFVFALWGITVVLVALDALVLQNFILVLFIAIAGIPQSIVSFHYAVSCVYSVLALVLGCLWLVYVFVSANYHNKHAGERKSWRALAWTIGVGLAILLLDLLT
jgi:hypothetical protein